MREITKERVVKDVIGYEANDGTRFDSKEECQKYEKSALSVVKERFKRLIVGETYEDDLMNAGCEDGIWYIIKIKNGDDVNTAAMYGSLRGCSGAIVTDDDIGKEVVIGTYDDYFWRVGTLDEIINRIKTSFNSAKEMYEKKERA